MVAVHYKLSPVLNGCQIDGEIGEPSVFPPSYLRDIYICMFVLSYHFATQEAICYLGTCPAESDSGSPPSYLCPFVVVVIVHEPTSSQYYSENRHRFYASS